VTFILSGIGSSRFATTSRARSDLSGASLPGSARRLNGESVLMELLRRRDRPGGRFLERSVPRSIASRTTFSTGDGPDTHHQEILKAIRAQGRPHSKVRESLVSIGRVLLYLANEADSMRWAKDIRSQLRGMQRDVQSLSTMPAISPARSLFVLDALLASSRSSRTTFIKIFSIAAVCSCRHLVASIYA